MEWAILQFGRFYILGDFGVGDFGVGRFCHLTLVTYRISVDRGASKCSAGQIIRVFRILTEPTLCVLLLFNSGDSEEKAFVPLYDNFVTQRATLGNATVFSISSYQLDGVQPQVLCKLCFSTAAIAPQQPWLEGCVVTHFTHFLEPIIRERGVSSLSPKPRSSPSGIRSRFRTRPVYGSADTTDEATASG